MHSYWHLLLKGQSALLMQLHLGNSICSLFLSFLVLLFLIILFRLLIIFFISSTVPLARSMLVSKVSYYLDFYSISVALAQGYFKVSLYLRLHLTFLLHELGTWSSLNELHYLRFHFAFLLSRSNM